MPLRTEIELILQRWAYANLIADWQIGEVVRVTGLIMRAIERAK